jgi:hypothetical protein
LISLNKSRPWKHVADLRLERVTERLPVHTSWRGLDLNQRPSGYEDEIGHILGPSRALK